MTRKAITHFCELTFAMLATVASFSACKSDERNKQQDWNKKNQCFLVNHTSIIKPLNTDTSVHIKTYANSAEEWNAVKNELLEYKKHGYFAPAITDSIDMRTSNCYNAAIGVDVIKSSCVYPGIIGHVEDTSIAKLPWDWHLKYDEMNDLAVALQQDDIVKDVPRNKENSYFPIIAFTCKEKKTNFHFVRPYLNDINDEIAFSEKQSCVYPLRKFNNFADLKKQYNDNQQYIHPTVFYVPKNYQGAKLILNNSE